MKRAFLFFFLFASLYSSIDNCESSGFDSSSNRSLYSIGDTLSIYDQNLSFEVCHGENPTIEGEIFKFSDLNGDLNGGDYNIILISMNATW